MQMIFILPELWWWWNLLGYHIGFPMQEQELFANIWMQFILEVINKSKMNCSWRKESWSNKKELDQMNFHKKRNTKIGPRGKICSSNSKKVPLEIFPSGLCWKTQLLQGNFFIWNRHRKHRDNFVGWLAFERKSFHQSESQSLQIYWEKNWKSGRFSFD